MDYSLYIWFDFIDHGAAVLHWTMRSGSYVLDKATSTNCKIEENGTKSIFSRIQATEGGHMGLLT